MKIFRPQAVARAEIAGSFQGLRMLPGGLLFENPRALGRGRRGARADERKKGRDAFTSLPTEVLPRTKFVPAHHFLHLSAGILCFLHQSVVAFAPSVVVFVDITAFSVHKGQNLTARVYVGGWAIRAGCL